MEKYKNLSGFINSIFAMSRISFGTWRDDNALSMKCEMYVGGLLSRIYIYIHT